MRVLTLAKELGVSYTRLLEWAARSNLPYHDADDEIDPSHVSRIRRVFTPGASSRTRSGEGASIDDLLKEATDPSFMPDDVVLPDSLEELESIERELMKSPPELKIHTPRPERTSTKDVLNRYGITGKAILKKLRKILPEDVVRLLNQQDLSKDQVTTLTGELENRAALFCDHPYCRKATAQRHSPEILVPVRDSAYCSVCAGSPTRRALEEASEECHKAGFRRILVVGGMPGSQNELKQNAPAGLDFRLVDGELDRQRQRVQADLRWCDLAVIWGSTPLGHSLSGSYINKKAAHGPFILRITRRSVEALCQEIVRHLKCREKD